MHGQGGPPASLPIAGAPKRTWLTVSPIKIPVIALLCAFLPACDTPTPKAAVHAENSAGGNEPSAPVGTARFESALDAALAYPTRIAVSDDGAVFVADTDAGRVFGYRGGRRHIQIGGLDHPTGLASRGRLLYVGVGGRHAVSVLDLVTQKPVAEIGAGTLTAPTALAVAPDDQRLYVVDSRRDVVEVFSPAGDSLGHLGETGSGDGQFHFPAAIAVDAQRVVVADQGNHRVQIFDRAGRFVRSIGEMAPTEVNTAADFAGRFTRVQGLALVKDTLYALDAYHGHVQAFDLATPEPRFLGFLGRRGDCDACFGLGLDLAADGHGDLLVTDPEAHRWVSLKAGGQ